MDEMIAAFLCFGCKLRIWNIPNFFYAFLYWMTLVGVNCLFWSLTKDYFCPSLFWYMGTLATYPMLHTCYS